jgi:hypothetical protein
MPITRPPRALCACTFNSATGKWEPPAGGCPQHAGPWLVRHA